MERTAALVTWAGLPRLARDDRMLAEALGERGIRAEAAVWDRPDVRWDRYDLVLLRSCWDYHLKPDEFATWFQSLEGMVRLWNPARTVLWNMDKRYLLELYSWADGPETRWVARGTTPDAFPSIASLGWERVVVKPAVSATAHKTVLVSADDQAAFRAALVEISARSSALIQPFLPEIARHGEWSLCFIGEGFSHGVIKRPSPGDFRVQTCFGGTHEAGDPPPVALAAARRILERLARPWLYARVDGVMSDGRFLLLELELIEPSLYLDGAPGSVERFADAIATLLA